MTNDSAEESTIYQNDDQISLVERSEEPEVQGDSTTTKTIFGEIAEADPNPYPEQVLSDEDEPLNDEIPVAETPRSRNSIFGGVSEPDSYNPPKEVLAGADVADEAVTTTPTTETTVVTETTSSDPNLDTGITSITVGLISAFTLFISAMIFVYKNPRKYALTSFEKNVTKKL
jgi:hypothetical protein